MTTESGIRRLLWQRKIADPILSYPVDSDQDVVIYFPVSGETHYLNVVEHEALMCLSRNAGMTMIDWQQKLATQLSIEVDDQLCQYLEELAAQMEEYGLIESVSP